MRQTDYIISVVKFLSDFPTELKLVEKNDERAIFKEVEKPEDEIFTYADFDILIGVTWKIKIHNIKFKWDDSPTIKDIFDFIKKEPGIPSVEIIPYNFMRKAFDPYWNYNVGERLLYGNGKGDIYHFNNYQMRDENNNPILPNWSIPEVSMSTLKYYLQDFYNNIDKDLVWEEGDNCFEKFINSI